MGNYVAVGMRVEPFGRGRKVYAAKDERIAFFQAVNVITPADP
jgi:hypothetical protein